MVVKEEYKEYVTKLYNQIMRLPNVFYPYIEMRFREKMQEKVFDDNAKTQLITMFDSIIKYCMILFEGEHCSYYAVVDKTNYFQAQNRKVRIPQYLPANYHMLCEVCSLISGFFFKCCPDVLVCYKKDDELVRHKIESEGYPYPNYEEMKERIEDIDMLECMTFFGYYTRLVTRYGQQGFFEMWKDGTALRVLKRLSELSDQNDTK